MQWHQHRPSQRQLSTGLQDLDLFHLSFLKKNQGCQILASFGHSAELIADMHTETEDDQLLFRSNGNILLEPTLYAMTGKLKRNHSYLYWDQR
jgi:hypothetical protein